MTKIDLKTMKIDFIGKEPGDFRALAMNKKTKDALMNPQAQQGAIEDILSKHSFINGLIADKDIVGVLYVNRDKEIDDELYYSPRIQIYDHSGKLLHEQHLINFVSEQRYTPYFYQKNKKRLFLLSSISNESTVKYVMYEYSIEP